jgi:hypothetical protein
MPEVTLHEVSNLALATGDADLLQQMHTLVDPVSVKRHDWYHRSE